ncbi:hypothetical protein AB4865_03655 [Capnocytophaga sp. ARDL2]|uniref:hypothetical protein n=1 Tax=Capnocytophaga sp. ARDL2 TaxID=3238809 RepID=UPI003555C470
MKILLIYAIVFIVVTALISPEDFSAITLGEPLGWINLVVKFVVFVFAVALFELFKKIFRKKDKKDVKE